MFGGGARVVSAAAAERAAILKELQPKLLELSKSPYGHFVVSRLIALSPKQQLPGAVRCGDVADVGGEGSGRMLRG